jgi:hypothetical protein
LIQTSAAATCRCQQRSCQPSAFSFQLCCPWQTRVFDSEPAFPRWRSG